MWGDRFKFEFIWAASAGLFNIFASFLPENILTPYNAVAGIVCLMIAFIYASVSYLSD